MRPLTLVGPLVLLSGCAGNPVIVASPSSCSTLIPEAWHQPVPGAPLPEGNTVGDWVAFSNAQTGQLDRANGRQADTLAIISACERRDRDSLKRAKPKFLGVL